MRKYHKITPEGTKDLLFEECLTHRYVELWQMCFLPMDFMKS